MSDKLTEIRERWSKVRYECGHADENAYADDVGHLLSLLQQPTTSERCVKCGHNKDLERSTDGTCNELSESGDDQRCGCKCVFPATSAPRFAITELLRAALEHPESVEGNVRQAIEMLGTATVADEGEQHECKPCGYHASVCCQCGTILSSANVAETEPQHVYCPVCSKAGGADSIVYHAPPVCEPPTMAPPSEVAEGETNAKNNR